MCQMSIASSCSATIVEVEQSAEPLAALDRRITVGRSRRLLGRYEQPVADTLVVPLAVVVRDIFRNSTPQVAFTRGTSLLKHSDLIESTNLSATEFARAVNYTQSARSEAVHSRHAPVSPAEWPQVRAGGSTADLGRGPRLLPGRPTAETDACLVDERGGTGPVRRDLCGACVVPGDGPA